MATTPEGVVKKAVIAMLIRLEAYYHMPVQQGYGRPSLDFIICMGGRFVAIEAKAPGKKPTAIQWKTIKKMQAAGGLVFVIDNVEQVPKLEGVLEKLCSPV